MCSQQPWEQQLSSLQGLRVPEEAAAPAWDMVGTLQGGPAGSEGPLSWRLRGSSPGRGGGHIYLISCTLLPLSFCIGRKKGLSLGRGERGHGQC